jgi:hypothetical protein
MVAEQRSRRIGADSSIALTIGSVYPRNQPSLVPRMRGRLGLSFFPVVGDQSSTSEADSVLRRILLLGSSEITFDDYGSSPSFTQLLNVQLAESNESRWEVTPHIIYQRSNMPDRCLHLAERESPDLVVLWLGGNVFSEETVSFAVYNRSPRLHRYFDRLARALRGSGAARIEDTGGPRRVALLALRRASRAIIGQKPFIDPEEALAATIQSLDILRPRWRLLCRLPFRDSCRQPDQEESSRQRVESYNAAVIQACRERQITCISPSDEIEAAGARYAMAADKLHADLPSRRRNAVIAARYIKAAVSGID